MERRWEYRLWRQAILFVDLLESVSSGRLLLLLIHCAVLCCLLWVSWECSSQRISGCRAANSARVFLTWHLTAVSCSWTSRLLPLWERLCSSALNWLVLSWTHHLALRNTPLSQICSLLLIPAPCSVPLMVRVHLLVPCLNSLSLKSMLHCSWPCLMLSFLFPCYDVCLAPHLSSHSSILEVACLPHPHSADALCRSCVDAAISGFSGPGHPFPVIFWYLFSCVDFWSPPFIFSARLNPPFFYSPSLAHTEAVFSLCGFWKWAQRFTKEIQKKEVARVFSQLFLETLVLSHDA